VAQHTRNAGELSNFIRGLMQWKIAPELFSAQTVASKQLQIHFNAHISASSDNYAGFSVSDSITQYTIDSIVPDNSDPSILNIYTTEPLSPSRQLYLHYIPGTVESTDTILLEQIDSFAITNTLTETIIAEAIVNTSGEYIKLTFNKRLIDDVSFEGLSFYTRNRDITIDTIMNSLQSNMFFVDQKIVQGDSVFVDYSGSGIVGADDIPLEQFSGMVINNTSNEITLSEVLNFKQFKIWPNPNKDGLFRYQKSSSDINNFEVISQQGQVVMQGTLQNAEGEISLETLSEGLYYLKIYTLAQSETHRLLIQN
jgi:hypothetical protein